MRLLGWFGVVLVIAGSSACSRREGSHHSEGDEINLNQNVTVKSRAQDVVFKDFATNWRKFISQSPQLALPVVGTVQRAKNIPEAIITPECLYLQSADGYVPRITVTWNAEPSVIPQARATKVKAGTPGQEQPPEMRFDLGLHHDAFSRDYYSSVLSTEVNQRFELPSNSHLVSDAEAVRLTGPGLFPQLVSFRSELLNDTATNRQISRNTLVAQELGEGLSYQLRVSRPSGNQWVTEQQFTFVTPVCPTSF